MTDTRMNSPDSLASLQPPPYLTELRDLLRENEKELWEWFRSDKHSDARREAVRLDLLKSTVRIDPEGSAALHLAANSAANALDLDVPLTIYQAQQTGQFNASISAEADEAHIVLEGELAERLDQDELTAVFGHEFGHLLLWNLDDGDYLVAANLLSALVSGVSVSPVHLETIRLFSQYTEVFCDRCALLAAGKFDPVVASLIKIATGLKQVRVNDYLKQANEIFARDDDKQGSETVTHPELYIRTRALDLWKRKSDGFEAEIAKMVQGKISLDRMDLNGQQKATRLTRDLLNVVLEPEWMQCEATLSQAKLYLEDYDVGTGDREMLAAGLVESDEDFLDYVCYVMLDFVTADRELVEPALGHTIALAGLFKIKTNYVNAVLKELRMTKGRVARIVKQADELAKEAAERKQNPDPENLAMDSERSQ